MSGRAGEIFGAEEAEAAVAGKECLLPNPLWALGIVVNVAPVHFDALGYQSMAQVYRPFESAFAPGVFFPWVLGSGGGGSDVEANYPHADDGGIDGVEDDAEIVPVALEADVVVGHGSVGAVNSSHSADVLGDDLVGAYWHPLVEGSVPAHGLKVAGLADHVVMQNTDLLPVHPCGALDNSCGVVVSTSNCLLCGTGPSSGDQLLGGVGESMECKVGHSAR